MRHLLYNIGVLLAPFFVIQDKVKYIIAVVRSGYYSKRFYSITKDLYVGLGIVLYNSRYIKLGFGCSFGRYGVLSTWGTFNDKPKLIIGDNCEFGDYIHITAFNEINIGNNVLTGRWVTISDNSHGQTKLHEMKLSPMKRPIYSKGPINIKDNVWIGDKVTILAGVTIGESAIIGANTVITKDVPPYSVAVGVPMRIISIKD